MKLGIVVLEHKSIDLSRGPKEKYVTMTPLLLLSSDSLDGRGVYIF